VLFDRFMIEEQFGGVLPKTVLMHYSIGYRRFTLLETSTAKACKEGRFFYLTDLFAEDVAKRKLPVYCVAIFL
jgi:hypothetical protein